MLLCTINGVCQAVVYHHQGLACLSVAGVDTPRLEFQCTRMQAQRFARLDYVLSCWCLPHSFARTAGRLCFGAELLVPARLVPLVVPPAAAHVHQLHVHQLRGQLRVMCNICVIILPA
jgi:hypothetical protein